MENNWINFATTTYYHDQVNWNVALGVIVLMLMYAMWHTYQESDNGERYSQLPLRRGQKMRRRARREYVRRQAIDAFVDYVEERVFHKEFTRAEASELYRDARKYWPVRELFPSPELLKENIKRRLAATSKNQPVSFPDKEEKVKVPMFKGKPTKLVKA